MSRAPRPGLAAARAAAGLSQSQLGERAGIPTRVVSFYETGIREPGVDAALALARALDASVEELFTRAPGTEAGRAVPEETSPQAEKETTDAQR